MKNGLIIEGGVQYWYRDDKYHREDGPAVLYSDGSESWYINGIPHRLDGPAITFADKPHRNIWCLNGENVPCKTQEEFERLLRLKAFW